MMTNLTKLAAAGALGLAGVGVLGMLPASAETEDTATEQSYLSDRLQGIRDALAGLVTDGTITQDQADRVAETLNRSDALRGGPGHHGGGGLSLSAAAEALGLTEDELRDALADGSTLAEIAEAEGVDTATLVDALVAAAGERLDRAVADGRLTQEQADDRRADLEERITEAVEEGPPFGGPGHHGRDFGAEWPDHAEEGSTTDDTQEGTSGTSTASTSFLV